MEFRIHIAFLFLLAVLLLISSHPADPRTIVRALGLTALILISVYLHELAHAVAALRNRRPMRGSILLPLGGLAATDPNPALEPGTLGAETRIAVAGPMINLFMASVSGTILLSAYPQSSLLALPLVTVDWLSKSFFWINVGLFAINLLPAFPLDGGRVLRAWLAQRMEYRLATRRAVTLANLIAAAFMLGGLETQWSLLIGFVLFLATQMEERMVMFHAVAESVHMEDVMLTDFSTLSPADTLEDALSKAVHSLQDDFPVVSGGDLVGVINRQAIIERLRREGNGYVQSAMNKAFEIAARSESLASAFRKLTARGLTLIPVVDEERLVGIVTLQNLMHSMGLLAEARRFRRKMEQS